MLKVEVSGIARVVKLSIGRLVSRLKGSGATLADKRRRFIARGRRGKANLRFPAGVVELPSQGPAAKPAPTNPTILILMLSHIGDFVLSLKALTKLREGFPGSNITIVVASWNLDWARGCGLFDRVVEFNFFPRLNKDWSGPTPDIFVRFEALPLGEFDVAIDLRHDADTRPCLFAVAANVRAGFSAPHREGRPHLDLMLPQVEKLPLSNGEEYSIHAELRLELLADLVIGAFANRAKPHPILSLMDSSETKNAPRPYVILALGAGDPIRRWPTQRFAEVAEKLIQETGLDIALVGGAMEKAAVDAVAARLPPERVSRIVDLPLKNLVALVYRSSLLVGLGTGVTHLAATLGIPTVAILSGVSPLTVWRPVGQRVISLTGEMPCSPCGFKEERQCPFDVACLSAISPDHVLAAARRLLGAPTGRGIGSVVDHPATGKSYVS